MLHVRDYYCGLFFCPLLIFFTFSFCFSSADFFILIWIKSDSDDLFLIFSSFRSTNQGFFLSHNLFQFIFQEQNKLWRWCRCRSEEIKRCNAEQHAENNFFKNIFSYLSCEMLRLLVVDYADFACIVFLFTVFQFRMGLKHSFGMETGPGKSSCSNRTNSIYWQHDEFILIEWCEWNALCVLCCAVPCYADYCCCRLLLDRFVLIHLVDTRQTHNIATAHVPLTLRRQQCAAAADAAAIIPRAVSFIVWQTWFELERQIQTTITKENKRKTPRRFGNGGAWASEQEICVERDWSPIMKP